MIDQRQAVQPQTRLLRKEVSLSGEGVASAYAAHLLEDLDVRVCRSSGQTDPHPAIAWALSGAMELTGLSQGPPLLAPGPLASCADGAAKAFDALCPDNPLAKINAAALLGERAACFGYSRQGRRSPGGSCRLLPGADGWIALNLARPEDIELLPAWLGEGDTSKPWAFASTRIAQRPTAALIERARLLGLPTSRVECPPASAPPWFRIAARSPRRTKLRNTAPLVIDLSSLWAGPLCSHLLGIAGARVIKIESSRRPDGARRGPANFFNLLNAGKQSIALNFKSEEEIEKLRRLLRCADIVIEGSRPRALAQLGIDVVQILKQTPGLTWVSLTGYGRREPYANRVAFGDDAGAAAGLAAATGGEIAPLFCGDALPDPLTGLHAALAALAGWRSGGGLLLDLSLRNVAAHALCFRAETQHAASVSVERRAVGWEVRTTNERATVAVPRIRRPLKPARTLGADTRAVFTEFGIPC